MWEEAVVTSFEALFLYLPGRTEITKYLNQVG
jgi:hypothetical protein